MTVIEVSHVSKEYRLGTLKSLKQNALDALARMRGRPAEERPRFKALDDVSFCVQRGEVVGIIGHNGAGKSTLLKLLAQISTPSHGALSVKGKVAPLIEVGAGLVPDFTGRENIYLNGAILGIKRAELARKFDDIVAFAELQEFIDTPVKRYSSGMQVRLGFSIATSVEADILIVDEVLAVGDLAFQRKCFDRMEEMIKRQGKTVLLVSHNIRQVERLCDRAILLDHGKIVVDGDKTQVCERYYQYSNAKIAAQAATAQRQRGRTRTSGIVELESLTLVGPNGAASTELAVGDPVAIRCVLNVSRTVHRPEIVIGFQTTDFFYVASMSSAHIDAHPDLFVGSNVVECRIANMPLMPGVYSLRLAVFDGIRAELFYGEMLKSFAVTTAGIPRARMAAAGVVHIPAEWAFQGSPVAAAPCAVRGGTPRP
jgi:ABC-type polysaccharide/polyol phosphate transport system ATPase subunit